MADLREVQMLAVSLMRKHGLVGWKFGFDKAKNRHGVCRYGKKTIRLSKYFTHLNDLEKVNTATSHANTVQGKYSIVCPVHGVIGQRHRKTRNMLTTPYYCKKCRSKVSFEENK